MSGMVFKMGGGAGTIKKSSAPQITFNGKWSGWHIEYYNDEPYWEALFSSSGTLVSLATYLADLWGIGGGGAGGGDTSSSYASQYYGTGGGSGYTNMVENTTISAGSHSVTIGGGGSTKTYDGTNSKGVYTGATGGTTKFLSLSCSGGAGGNSSGGSGGSNGGSKNSAGGSNGSPGSGKIMSKFWSTEHNSEYGAGGAFVATDSTGGNGGGGGGYLPVGSTSSAHGQGYGGGGGGIETSGYYDSAEAPWYGNAGCLIIRIKIN